jgi:hypothetical protein
MKATAAFGIVIGLAAGCGGGSSGGLGLNSLPAARGQAVCAQNYKCNSAADLMNEKDSMDKPLTQQQCVMNIQTAWSLTISSISDGQTKGRLTYDPAVAQACITAIKAMSCDDWNNGLKQPPECMQAFVAKVAVGGKCGSDFDCIGGTCDGADASTTPPTDGTCKAKIASGAACTFNDTCADGTYCGSANTCVAQKAGGAACVGDNECGSGNCNETTSQCSGFVSCNAGPTTPRSTLVSIVGLALVLGAVRRRRR